MDALDAELKVYARQALEKMGGDVEAGAVLLKRWVEAGSTGKGLVDRILLDYLRAVVSEEAQPVDA